MAETSIERSTALAPHQRAQAIFSSVRGRWVAMQPRQRTSILAYLVLAAALCSLLLWWSGRPQWRTLFSGLDGRDLQQVEQQLSAASIHYQSTPDGIQVPTEQVDKARMAVATKGMPSSGRMGFEIFDRPNWVGSEFDEKVNYQRALEGELEQSIQTIDAVRSARVHLVMPKESLFAAEEHPATASVILKLRHGLGLEQADSIRSLVAGAVENLHADAVTLVDADGRSDLSKRTPHESEHGQESALEEKLVAMLEPLAGQGNVRATVNVAYDEGTEERTDDTYDPQSSVAVSVQRSEQSSSAPQKGTQPAGASSNTPAAQNAKPDDKPDIKPDTKNDTKPEIKKDMKDLPVFPQNASAQTQNIREESSSYAVNHHLLHVQEGPGRIRRVAAAIVVNDRATEEMHGRQLATMWKPRTADEMHRLEQIAQAAVGFDSTRGDSVVVQNIGFSSNTSPLPASTLERLQESGTTLLRTQPELPRLAGMIVIGLLLVLFVLRPMVTGIGKALSAPLPQPILSLPHSVASDRMEESHSTLTPQHILQRVASHVHAEPQASTRVLEGWITSPMSEVE